MSEYSKPARMPTTENVSSLWEAGYFDYADPDIFERLRADVMCYGLFGALETGRDFSVDAEVLAEGGADVIIESDIGPFLTREGINVARPREKYVANEDAVYLLLGSREILLHQRPNVERAWVSCSKNFFAVINGLLSECGSEERMYACYPFQDEQLGVFLTPKLFEALSNMGLANGLHRIDGAP